MLDVGRMVLKTISIQFFCDSCAFSKEADSVTY